MENAGAQLHQAGYTPFWPADEEGYQWLVDNVRAEHWAVQEIRAALDPSITPGATMSSRSASSSSAKARAEV